MKHVPFLGKLIIMGVIPLAVLGIAVGILSFRQAALVVRQSQKRVISDTEKVKDKLQKIKKNF